jgi:hypothetical protein
MSATLFGLNLEGPLGNRGSFLFSARRSYLDAIMKLVGMSFVPEYWDVLGKADYQLDASNSLSLLGIAAIDRIRRKDKTEEQRFENSREFMTNQNRILGAASWEHLFRRGFTSVTIGETYAGYGYRLKDSLLQPLFTDDVRENEASLRADAVFKLNEKTTVSGGAQGKLVRFRSDLQLPPFMNSFGKEIAVDTLYDTTGFKGSAYLQLSRTLGRLRLTPGCRFDYFDLIEHGSVISPRMAASYSLNPGMDLNVAVGRYHQSPSYAWLVANPANHHLSHIRVDQYILGITRRVREDTKVTLEGFRKNYFRYPASVTQPWIVLANTGAGFGGREEGFVSFGLDPLSSDGTGRSQGIELSVQKKLSQSPWYGIFSLTCAKATFKARDGIRRDGSFDQRWIMNFGGGYVFNEKWEVTSRFRLATGAPFTPYNPDGTQSAELYNSGRLDINHSLDLRVDRRWAFKSWAMVTYIDIQNIYNHGLHEPPEYNERTRTVETTHMIGILPSIGVTAEF